MGVSHALAATLAALSEALAFLPPEPRWDPWSHGPGS